MSLSELHPVTVLLTKTSSSFPLYFVAQLCKVGYSLQKKLETQENCSAPFRKKCFAVFCRKLQETHKMKNNCPRNPFVLFLLKKMSTMLRTENPDAEVTKTMSIIIMSTTDIVSNEYTQVTTKQIAFFFSPFALQYTYIFWNKIVTF